MTHPPDLQTREAADLATRSRLLQERFQQVRSFTERICAPLEIEDHVIQPSEDVSPPKWHLGHTTWFFETFLLERFQPGYRCYHPGFAFLFNSYYESAGERILRPRRGLISRPTVAEVRAYRAAIDKGIADLFASVSEADRKQFCDLVEIGVHHEEQHQELLFTDIKSILFHNPLWPVYLERAAGAVARADSPAVASPSPTSAARQAPPRFLPVGGGVHAIGVDNQGLAFAYDNESPKHRVYVNDFSIASRPVTCGEYLEFIRDGGYRDFRHWLSDGWSRVNAENWQAPLYWVPAPDGRRPFSPATPARDLRFQIFTLGGLRDIDPDEILCHISYYEALAYASWAGYRLPTEAEWEISAQHFELSETMSGNFAGTREHGVPHPERYHPGTAGTDAANVPAQMFGDVWEWTGSAYLPYPGYRSLDGALAEYNGKFMSDQMVLRGGSCATPAGHIRATYRNFFQPYQRWQFSGLRLARDGGPL
jgi:ergothioneine biosynthesis protein EgtB